MSRRWALAQSVQVIIPPELVRRPESRVLSKSDLEEYPMTQRLNYTAIAPAGVKALGSVYGYIVQSGLPRQLVNLVYLRASQINGCAYCIDMHSRDLIKEGLAVEKLVLIPAWREAGSLFDTRERAALAWTETVTRVADTAVPDADFQAASAVFSEKELADLTIAIGLMNAYNRLAIGFRVPPKAALSDRAT
jgi:AhpD family alkylhydroperoxidase